MVGKFGSLIFFALSLHPFSARLENKPLGKKMKKKVLKKLQKDLEVTKT